jgi:hypothetical protein
MSSQATSEIAASAARLIADGETDYATAKRKAAMALGLSTREVLPSNLDVDEALRQHYALYVPEQTEVLAAIRREALHWMQKLASFSPWLSGPVLTGTANIFTPITLELVGCDVKAFDIWLINARVTYSCEQQARAKHVLTKYCIDDDGLALHVLLFDTHAARAALFPANSVHHERINATALEVMLQS